MVFKFYCARSVTNRGPLRVLPPILQTRPAACFRVESGLAFLTWNFRAAVVRLCVRNRLLSLRIEISRTRQRHERCRVHRLVKDVSRRRLWVFTVRSCSKWPTDAVGSGSFLVKIVPV